MECRREIIDLARQFLLGYFVDGVYAVPSSLDKMIFGDYGKNFYQATTLHMSFQFNSSPFGKALHELMEEGLITYAMKSGIGFCYFKTRMYEKNSKSRSNNNVAG